MIHRSREVRKAAQDSVPAFMRHLGFEGMRKVGASFLENFEPIYPHFQEVVGLF